MLEQKIIRDIKDTYDELLHDVMPIEHLPTNVTIETLSTSQQDYLLRLIRDKEVLLICISLKINHQIIDVDELNPEDLQIKTLKNTCCILLSLNKRLHCYGLECFLMKM